MQLKTVYFDAFRSLLDVRLELSHGCIALVGVNESGKTNVLRGLSSLSSKRPLTSADIPKMNRKKSPRIRFEFELAKDDILKIEQEISETSILKPVSLKRTEAKVFYHVELDRNSGEERRFFSLRGASVPEGTLVLKNDVVTDGYFMRVGDQMICLEEAVIINKNDLKANEEMASASHELTFLNQELKDLESTIASFEVKINELHGAIDADNASVTPPATPETEDIAGLTDVEKSKIYDEIKARSAEHSRLCMAREKLLRTQSKLEAKSAGCELSQRLRELVEEIDVLETVVANIQDTISESTDASEKDVEKAQKAQANKKLRITEAKLASLIRERDSLQQPLSERFTDDLNELELCLGEIFETLLFSRLPKVVRWTYSSEYILDGETEFKRLKGVSSLSDIPRPLLNVFRIGLGIEDLEDLNNAIAEIEEDSSERSRSEDRLNRRVDEYLKSVWKDYDQKIRIGLEQDRIRIQFYDPNCNDASYYKMQERSQGCQTFVSFLLTIGAEAKQGVISNTVLLLDEPETHLHPSGVRFMLRELIETAKSGNNVVFATHSVFMIDQADYDRHIIVKKVKERTKLMPSSCSRIGFFMQEEVLYAALDVDLASDLSPRRNFNFVFEGHGDAILFQGAYRVGMKGNVRPFEMTKTSFYHGGKCSDIIKYFSHKPIQLGTYWVFILDSDEPANELRKFLQAKYSSFLGTYIHVFQFSRDDTQSDVELEDLLPAELIREVLQEAANKLDEEVDISVSSEDKSFAEYIELALRPAKEPKNLKAEFKHCLNREIEKRVDSISDENVLRDEFPDFCEWAIKTIESIPKPGKPPKKTSK